MAVAAAFRDTSPFFMFSTSALLTPSPNLVSASSLSHIIISQLQKCLSDTYIIVSQPGVNEVDYHDQQSTPILGRMVLGNDEGIRSSSAVRDVKGAISGEELSKVVQTRCGAGRLRLDASTGSFAIADEANPRVINLDFPSPPSGNGREAKLLEHDAFLGSVLDILPLKRYTVIYITTPSDAPAQPERAESQSYEMDSIFHMPVHMELKRDVSHHKRASDGNVTLPAGPLFERYQFLSPGMQNS
ncbi:MAG: hypothetical protein Q9163_002722 [Psora crenata]